MPRRLVLALSDLRSYVSPCFFFLAKTFLLFFERIDLFPFWFFFESLLSVSQSADNVLSGRAFYNDFLLVRYPLLEHCANPTFSLRFSTSFRPVDDALPDSFTHCLLPFFFYFCLWLVSVLSRVTVFSSRVSFLLCNHAGLFLCIDFFVFAFLVLYSISLVPTW